jgi:hypothetical protein
VSPPPLAFYLVCNSDFFLGAVALVNSLRLLGHAEPIFALDCGLSPSQRALLSEEATLVPAPADTTPYLLKTAAPLRHPAGVMVLIDADVIVTRRLTEPIERASHGRVLAVEHGRDRFFGEWGKLMSGTARHRPYVSSSLVFLGGEPGKEVIRLMDELQGRIELEGTPYARPRWADFSLDGGDFWELAGDHPFFFADQDVLNAVLATRLDPGRVEVLERRLEATVPFTGLRVVDERALRCAYEDGTEPHVLHHLTPVKPWLEPTIPGVYTQLLRRLLLGRDVAIPVPQRDLPLHLRPGVIAGARRWYRGPFMGSVRGLRERVRGAGTPTGA